MNDYMPLLKPLPLTYSALQKFIWLIKIKFFCHKGLLLVTLISQVVNHYRPHARSSLLEG